MTCFTFTVYGIPQTGGSKRAFFNKKTGKAIVVDDCKNNRPWRDAVIYACRAATNGYKFSGPVSLQIKFVMPRPKAHYKAGAPLRESAPLWCSKRPDTTKLIRPVEDALTEAGLWIDDAQVVYQSASKYYGEQPRAEITVKAIEP